MYSRLLQLTTRADAYLFEAGKGLKVVAWQKFYLQKWSLLDRI